MRNIIKLLTALFVGLILLSCEKNNLKQLSDEEIIETAKIYYQKQEIFQSSTIINSKGKFLGLLFNPEWNKAVVKKIGDVIAITIPIETNLQKITSENTRFNLVLESKNNVIAHKIISVESIKKDAISSVDDLYNTAFNKINLNEKSSFNANVKVFSANFKLDKMISFSDRGANLISNKYLKKINDGENPNGYFNSIKTSVAVEFTKCTDWYLVVKSYDANDNVTSTSTTYLSTTCITETREVDFIEPVNPNGSGGNDNQNANFDYKDLGEAVSEAEASENETEETLNGVVYKIKPLKWRFYKGPTLYFTSTEKGVIRVENNSRMWHSLTHTSIDQGGFWLLGYAEPINVITTPHVNFNNSYMEISFGIKYTPTVSIVIGSSQSPISITVPPFTVTNQYSVATWNTQFIKQ